jgi:hypothetical protein
MGGRSNRWCGLSGLSWDPPGWERVGKGVDSPESHTVQEGPLVICTDTSGETSMVMLQTRGNH